MMMTKTQWLDWVKVSTDRLLERYRQQWRRPQHASKREQPEALPKPWTMIHPEFALEDREVVVHLELPEPHTMEAHVRVIGQTLAISVLRRGNGIRRAKAQDCYRRAVPLPAQVDPRSAVHEVQGDELVIRLQRAARAKRRGAGAGAIRPQRTAGTAATAREQTITARQRANGATPRRAASAIDGSSLNVQTKRVKRIRAIA